MKNIPRIFIGTHIVPDTIRAIDNSIAHYLLRVMRQSSCLVFGDGSEYEACITSDGKALQIGNKTQHKDPSGNIILYFAPIKKLDDMLNMSTQIGVKKFVPVITERTVANHINWERMQKIVIEASEQSNRNSVPEIASVIKFIDLPFNNLIVADERAAYGRKMAPIHTNITNVLVGPEGGFSDSEFSMLEKNNVPGLSLGKTILRAELAAPIAISKVVI